MEPQRSIFMLTSTSYNHFIIAMSGIQSSSIFHLLQKKFKYFSSPLLYSALLMFYAFRKNDTPIWAKRIVMGALVYLITPLDAIPDLAPILGYTDDLGVLSYGLVMIAAYIDPNVRTSARQTLHAWIGPTEETLLQKVDHLL